MRDDRGGFYQHFRSDPPQPQQLLEQCFRQLPINAVAAKQKSVARPHIVYINDAEREKIVTAIDDQTLELLSGEMEAGPVGCEMIEFVLQNVNFSPAEKLCGLLFLDNSFGELMAMYNSAQSVEAFVEELVCEAKAIYGINVSDAEERGVVRMLKNAADPGKAILLARHRARKKVLNVFEKRRSLKLKKVS